MEYSRQLVEQHYGRGNILNVILDALRDMGKDVVRLAASDLAPVDEFHIRGREATVELAGRVLLRPGLRVLDVGSGLGGTVRYLASEHQCRVTGIDLTEEYVAVAKELANLIGLGDTVEFRQCSALNMPFEDDSFDLVWTEHVQMNIADKETFYEEIARVLTPQGQFVFHDIFLGPGGQPHFPVPWAEDGSISFLATPEAVRERLETAGFRILDWEDKSKQSLEWFIAAVTRLTESGPPPLGVHLLMGESAQEKFRNNIRNLEQQCILVVQAVMQLA